MKSWRILFVYTVFIVPFLREWIADLYFVIVDKMIQDILYMEKLFFQRDAINNYDRNYYTFDWKL